MIAYLVTLLLQLCNVGSVPIQTVEVGVRSSTSDDAQSRATCPEGYVVSHCEVQTGLVHTRSDGAFVDPASNGRVCVAVNGAGGPGAVARAVCTRDGKTTDPCNSEGPELPKFISLHSRGPSPSVSCPLGYEQLLCNARSPWLGFLTNKGVNSKGVIPSGNVCAVSRCSDRNWCEVTAVCGIIEDSEAYKTAVCPTSSSVEVEGLKSGAWDDAQSRATCPEGYVVSHCEVQTGLVHTRSDGAFVDPASNGRVCVAVNGAGGPGAVARAVCTRDGKTTDPCNSEGPELPKFISLHSRGPSPSVSCPLGYEQLLCNARSPWLGFLTNKGVNSKGVIPSGNVCAVSRCSDRNWCEVTAVCGIIEDSEAYKTAKCPTSSSVEVEGLTSGAWDDAQSRATCPEGYVVSHCEVQTGLVHTRSDGAFVDPASNGRVCVAVNGAGGPGAVARAVCTRDGKTTDPCNSEGPELPKFISLHSRGPSPSVSCPLGYEQLLCNARSPWLGFLTNKGVNSKGVIPSGNVCAVSRCSDRNWCEVTAVCRIIEDTRAYETAVCMSDRTVEGSKSSTLDDAQSRATCPEGYVVSHCEVQTGLVHTRSDGAFVDPASNGRVCVAVNGAGGPGAVARAVCTRDGKTTDPCNSEGPELPKFISLHSRGPSPSVSCPLGYEQLLCNARSPWLGFLTNKGVNSKGVIPSGNVCAVSRCSDRNWCEVTAVCGIIEDSEAYKTAKCPTSSSVRS